MNATGPLGGAVRHLRRAALLQGGAGMTDAELLERYVRHRDGDAFEALLRRHGPMVLGVCRRVLGNEADAEDAFQATFLILARKAATVVPGARVGNWLYGVAHNAARKARAMNSKRRQKERGAAARAATPREDGEALRAALDEELARLPEKYRVPVVLCELEGRTLREAARQLGWPRGTVASRLARARALLGKRLARRGLGLAGGTLAGALGRGVVTAGVPPSLVGPTLRAAAAFAAGRGTAAGAAKAVALAEGVLKAMLLSKIKAASAAVAAALLLGAALASAGGPTRAQGRLEREAPRVQPRPAREARGAGGPAWREKATLQAHKGAVLSVAFGPGLLATVGDDQIKFWDLATGKETAAFRPLPTKESAAGTAFAEFMPGSGWARFSPDGKRLAVGGREGGGVVMQQLAEKRTPGRTVGACLFEKGVPLAPDRDLTTWAFADGGKVWMIEVEPDFPARNVRTSDGVALEGHTGDVHGAAFSPEGKTLATVSEDRTVRLWDTATHKELATYKGHTDGVVSVAFSPDGRTLATGGKDSAVRLWDVTTGRLTRKLEGEDVPWCLAFSPEGKALAAGQNANTVAVWDVAAGTRTATLKGHTGPVRAVSFGPDGKALASGGDDHTVKLWERRAPR